MSSHLSLMSNRSSLSIASEGSILSTRATDSALGMPMGRRQRKAFALGLIVLGRVLLPESR